MGCSNSKSTEVATSAAPAANAAPAEDNGAPTLYLNYISPVARACAMVAAELGAKINIKELDMLKGEHKQEEYLKINPKGTVPAMTHGGECICESADIAKYFVNHFAKGNSLYPAEKAAEIDEMMDFIANNLYTHAGALTVGAFTGSGAPEEASNAMKEATKVLHDKLGDRAFLLGDEMTIADLFAFSNLTNTKLNAAYAHPDAAEIPGLISWGERIRAKPYFASTHKTFFAVMQSMAPKDESAAPTACLYIDYLSPVSRSAAAVAAEVGANLEIKQLALAKGEHKQEAYLKINPNGTVPSLVAGDLIINQSRDIGKHLAADHPLYSANVKETVDTILAFDDTEIFPCLPKIVLPVLFGGDPASDEEKAALTAKMTHICEVLGEKQFLGGECLSLADIFVYNNFQQAMVVADFPLPDGSDKLREWIERVGAMDSVRTGHNIFVGTVEAIKAQKSQ